MERPDQGQVGIGARDREVRRAGQSAGGEERRWRESGGGEIDMMRLGVGGRIPNQKILT
jgi:hypothetical protein